MKALLGCLLLIACTSWPALADPCTGLEAQLHLLSLYLSHGDVANAEQTLHTLEAIHPDCTTLILDRARLQAAKSEDIADETFVHYNSLQPQDAQGWAYLSRYLISQGEYERADAAASLATDNDAHDPVAMAVQAQVLDMKGNSQEAIKLLQQAITLNPHDAEALFQLGSIHDRAKHPKQAVQSFSAAVRICPSDARAWDYLALNLEPLGEIEKAQQAYTKAISVNHPGAYFDAYLPYNYGRFLMKRNNLPASKEQLDRAVELTPTVRAAWYERARLNMRLHNYSHARTDAEKAASLEETNGVIADLQVYTLLEEVYGRLGEKELALKYAELGRTTPGPVQSEDARSH